MHMGKRGGLQKFLNMSECHATIGRRDGILERLLQEVINDNKKKTLQQDKELSTAIYCNCLTYQSVIFEEKEHK